MRPPLNATRVERRIDDRYRSILQPVTAYEIEQDLRVVGPKPDATMRYGTAEVAHLCCPMNCVTSKEKY